MPDDARPDAPPGARWLCPSAELVDGGLARVFDVHLWGRPAHGFALRFDGRVVGYLNRCAHVPAEMDSPPGRFLDDTGRYIVCPFHGAVYEPAGGRCVAGPCRGERLMPVDVFEQRGQVYWYPSSDIQPPGVPDRTDAGLRPPAPTTP